MKRQEKVESTDREIIHELSFEDTTDYLWHSFLYSQGNYAAQQMLFREIARLRPGVRVSEAVTDEKVVRSQLDSYKKLLTQGAHLPLADIVKVKKANQPQFNLILKLKDDMRLDSEEDAVVAFFILLEFRNMKNVLNRPRSNRDYAGLLMPDTWELARAMIQKDYKNLFDVSAGIEHAQAKARPTTGAAPSRGAFQRDKSQFVSYVLRGERPPGPDVFADIMRGIREELKNGRIVEWLPEKDKEIFVKVHDLIERDKESHPGQSYLGSSPALAYAVALNSRAKTIQKHR